MTEFALERVESYIGGVELRRIRKSGACSQAVDRRVR